MGTPISRRYDPATTEIGGQVAVALEYVSPSTTFIGIYRDGVGVSNYELEMTSDDVNDTSVTPRWFTIPIENEGPDGARWGYFSFPMRFVRLNIEMFTVPLELKILQTSDRLYS